MVRRDLAAVQRNARDAIALAHEAAHRRACPKLSAERLEGFNVSFRRLHGIGVAAVRLIHDTRDAFGIDLGQVLRKSRALGPLVGDAKAALHRDVLLRAVQHLGVDDEAVAVLHKARIAAKLSLGVLKHGDAGAREPHQQGRGIALAEDCGALAGAAARCLAALEQERFRAGLAQMISAGRAADARPDDDRVVAHAFGSTPSCSLTKSRENLPDLKSLSIAAASRSSGLP